MSWTGPAGPFRLDLPVDVEACAAEVKAMKEWAPLYMYNDHTWRADWRASAIVGYSEKPTEVNSPITQMQRAVGAAGGNDAGVSKVHISQDMIKLTTQASSCPALLALANSIPGDNERVRINYLGPKGVIPKHRDPLHAKLWEDRRIARFHIPIILPTGCIFFSWDRNDQCHEICQTAGSIWFVDTGEPHMVVNATREGRYNLVVDKFLNRELRELMMDSYNVHAQRTARP